MFGRLGRLARGAARDLPAPFEREPAEHARLRRTDRRRADRRVRIGRVPQVGEDVEASLLDRRGLRVLVLVDHVLVERLHVELRRLRLHPRGDERREVLARVAVEEQLVVDDLIRRLGHHLRRRGSASAGSCPRACREKSGLTEISSEAVSPRCSWLIGAPWFDLRRPAGRNVRRERYAPLARQPPGGSSVKKLLLLLVVVALGAAIAKKVRTA